MFDVRKNKNALRRPIVILFMEKNYVQKEGIICHCKFTGNLYQHAAHLIIAETTRYTSLLYFQP